MMSTCVHFLIDNSSNDICADCGKAQVEHLWLQNGSTEQNCCLVLNDGKRCSSVSDTNGTSCHDDCHSTSSSLSASTATASSSTSSSSTSSPLIIGSKKTVHRTRVIGRRELRYYRHSLALSSTENVVSVSTRHSNSRQQQQHPHYHHRRSSARRLIRHSRQLIRRHNSHRRDRFTRRNVKHQWCNQTSVPVVQSIDHQATSSTENKPQDNLNSNRKLIYHHNDYHHYYRNNNSISDIVNGMLFSEFFPILFRNHYRFACCW